MVNLHGDTSCMLSVISLPFHNYCFHMLSLSPILKRKMGCLHCFFIFSLLFFNSAIQCNAAKQASSPYSQPKLASDQSQDVDPNVKKICNQTDFPSLCISSVAPLVNGSNDVLSVLGAALRAGKAVGKIGLVMLKRIANTPGMPKDVVTSLKECEGSYANVLFNFQNAIKALQARDVGTMKTTLSAVLTDIGDCKDDFSGTNDVLSAFSRVANKLENMTSNCLAMVNLVR